MEHQDLDLVPGREHYSFRYLRGGRLFSYAHQMNTIVSFSPTEVLEVGAGGGLVTAAMRAAGIAVTTLDVQPELHPDIVGSVTEIPRDDESFDVALCSQVLEHLPFDQFGVALSELRRVTRYGLVLSLPDASRQWYVAGRLPKLKDFRFAFHMGRGCPMPESAFKKSGHYWEIGYAGYPLKRILDKLRESGWRLDSTWRVPEMKYHRFFRLEK